MKLYLDTNLVSAFVLEDQPGERTAIAAVLSRGNSGALSLVTSALVAKELEPYRGDKRPEIVLLNEQFAKVPYVEAEAHVGYDSAWHDDFGAWSNPLYHVEPDWSALRRFGLDPNDAHHVMLAIRAACDAFLTCDARTILNRRGPIEGAYPIRLFSPSQFVAAYP